MYYIYLNICSAKNIKFRRMGRKFTFHYHILKHAWNAFLRMADINYQSLFSCPKCKDKPDVIILDGIAMAQRKQFLMYITK